ncbi:MAG: hypothetical protein CVU63_17780, partial [Deltaproteobacteria bacterium HGW-Deltaproteobacteria-20]
SISQFFKALFGGFNGQSIDTIGESFGAFINGYTPVFWHFVFMLATAIVVIIGVRKGIERLSKFIMPVLFGILVILAVFGLSLKGSGAGLAFLFKPDFSVVSWKTVALACGAAFFSLGVGNGVMVTLGSYMSKGSNLTKTATQVCFTDTLVAVIAGVAIFPAVFALGFEPTRSSGLAFVTVPAVFQAFPGGGVVHYLLTLLFFFLKILTVKDLEDVPWNIVLLFGGAMSIGFCLWQTGAAKWIAIHWLTLFQGSHWFIFVMGIAFFVLVMTNFIMNVAAIAISLPVALVIAPYLGVAPEVILFASLATAGMPFMLLVGAAPNAIAYGSKQFTSGQFFGAGIPASIMLLAVLALYILVIWPMMGMPVTLPPAPVTPG